MKHPWYSWHSQSSRITALALMVLSYWIVVQTHPQATEAERQKLAERFAFTEQLLSSPTSSRHPWQQWRSVHPGLEHLRAWISAVGAAASLTDLDDDTLPNEICWVDPRTDTVNLIPVPGTSSSFAPRTLDPRPLPFDDHTMAPMGCLPGDFDEDGENDVLVYYWGRSPIIFYQRQQQFVPHELCADRPAWYSNAATRADIDGDGHCDIIIGNYFPNDAHILGDAGDEPGSAATPTPSMQGSMSRGGNAGSEWVLLFEKTESTPRYRAVDINTLDIEGFASGWTLAVGAADLTDDALPELYFAQDFGPDRLLWNRSTPGNVAFELLEGPRRPQEPASWTLGRDSFKGMGVEFADVDNDGYFDIYVSNISSPFALIEAHFLFLSNRQLSALKDGVAPFQNQSHTLGLSQSSWGWEARLADFDNDGTLEALQATGFLAGDTNRWPELQELATANDGLLQHPGTWPNFQLGDDLCGDAHNPFFVRDDTGHFVDIAAEVGLGRKGVSRGIAVGDVDGDGDLDMVVANQWQDSYYYRNDTPSSQASLVLDIRRPLGETSLRIDTAADHRRVTSIAAIGAHATITFWGSASSPEEPITRVARVDGGDGHSGTRAPQLHFGLGDHPADVPVPTTLRWRRANGELATIELTLLPGYHRITLPEPERDGGVQ